MFRTIAVCLLTAHVASSQTPDPAKFEAIFKAAHAAGTFDGVAVITADGATVLQYAAGMSNREKKVPNTPATVFRLGSLTKQVTALLVMQEVSAGRVDLEQPVGRYLAHLPLEVAAVTVRQLLIHFSGLQNPSDGPEDRVPPFYLRTGPAAADVTENALGFCAAKPKRAPGLQFEYNNCDYIILGAVLESLTGKTYGVLLEERVIRPLGLKSWVLAPGDPARAPVTAAGYQENGQPDLFQNPAAYSAAGGLLGNAMDVAKWNEALLNHKLL